MGNIQYFNDTYPLKRIDPDYPVETHLVLDPDLEDFTAKIKDITLLPCEYCETQSITNDIDNLSVKACILINSGSKRFFKQLEPFHDNSDNPILKLFKLCDCGIYFYHNSGLMEKCRSCINADVIKSTEPVRGALYYTYPFLPKLT